MAQFKDVKGNDRVLYKNRRVHNVHRADKMQRISNDRAGGTYIYLCDLKCFKRELMLHLETKYKEFVMLKQEVR
jgi:hypothetical protein